MQVIMDNLVNFNLEKTITCGQCFNWIQLNPNDFAICIGDIAYRLYQSMNSILIDNGKQTSEREALIKTLYRYFDLGTDYTKEIIVDSSDTFAQQAMKAGFGLKILKQDPFEALISFIVSQRNNIPKIKTTLMNIRRSYGRHQIAKFEANEQDFGHKISQVDLNYYTFPTPEDLKDFGIGQSDTYGTGYRAPYIRAAARKVLENPGWLEGLKGVDSETCIELLKTLPGVGPKVANCVALFGLGHLDCFPIDVWMQRVIDTYYRGHLDPTTYGKYAGVMQQYMFYYIKYC